MHHDRQIAELLSTRVPCAFSANGTHMLTIGISQSKELVYLNAPCAGKENQKACKSAHMLDAITCVSSAKVVQGGFRRDLLAAQDIRAYLDDFASFGFYPLFRKSLFEILLVANRVGAQRITAVEPLVGKTKPIRVRKSGIITTWLRRHLPQELRDQFVVRWSVKSDRGASLFLANEQEIPVSMWPLAEVKNGKFELNNNTIRRSFQEKIGIDVHGKCVYCGVPAPRAVRHSNSIKHRTVVTAAIRHATQLLNNPTILNLVTTPEAEK